MSDDILVEDSLHERVAARVGRHAFSRTPESPFAKSMKAAQMDYRQARAEGVSKEDCCRGLEAVLRSVWPHAPTKFPAVCDTCDDTGWRMKTCTHEMRCGRTHCGLQHPAHEHPYAVPCDCASGDKRRKQVRQVEDEYAAAGKTAKRKANNWSR